MAGFWTRFFGSKTPKVNKPNQDEAYELEWRNRYLKARIEHLTKKIKKSGRVVPSQPVLPTNLNAKNEALTDIIKVLELTLKH